MPEETASGPLAGAEGAPSGRERLLGALRRPGSRGQVTVAVLLALLGFAAVVQVQTNHKDDKYAGVRQSDLIALVNSLSLASQRAEDEVAQLQRTRDSLRSDTDSRRTAVRHARQQATVLGILAGTVPAVGPGVRVKVRDPSGGVGTDQLLNGIEELRDSGAEAIEINDSVRVVAQTWLQDAGGGGVLVDGVRLAPPYVIDAIGDPHTLATALNFSGGFSTDIESVHGSVGIQRSKRVEVSSTRAPGPAKFAEPVPTS